jgi:hypothetical protein
MLPQRRMGGVPDALPTKYSATRLDLSPLRIEGVAAMAKPLGSELPSAATAATLNHKSVLA